MPDHIPIIALLAAATALAVAAVVLLAFGARPGFGSRARPPRAPYAASALAGPLALGAAFVVASRVTFEGVPAFPPTAASPWLVYLIAATAGGICLLMLVARRALSVAGAVAGAALAVALLVWPLKSLVVRESDSGTPVLAWSIGLTLMLALSAALTVRASRPFGESSGKLWHRFRDTHATGFALGLCLAVGALAIILCASAKLAELVFAIGFAWAGVFVAALLVPGFSLAPAAAVAVASYLAIWAINALFGMPDNIFSPGSRSMVVVPAVLAPAAVAVLALLPMPAWRRKGLVRLIALCLTALSMTGFGAAMAARSYFAQAAAEYSE